MSLYNDPVSKKIMLIGVLAFIHEDHNNLEVPAMVRGVAFKNELVPGAPLSKHSLHCIVTNVADLLCTIRSRHQGPGAKTKAIALMFAFVYSVQACDSTY